MLSGSWQRGLINNALGVGVAAVLGAAGLGCLAVDTADDDDTGEEVAHAAAAVQSSSAKWSFTLQGAPQEPQDVWIAALGNNTEGWNSGGSVCLGVLANDLGPNDPQPAFQPGEHATLLTDVVEAGVFGVDGTPVPAGDYVAPGLPADNSPPDDFTLAPGESFYVIFDGEVINSSNPPAFPFPVGSVLRFMFTMDYEGEGRQIVPVALWVGVPSGGGAYSYFPFLNEGIMMLNARQN